MVLISFSILFFLINQIVFSSTSQQIKIKEGENSCETKLIDYLKFHNISFLENQNLITVGQVESISLSLNIEDCTSERQILFQNITNLNIEELKIQSIDIYKTYIITQNVVSAQIQNLEINDVNNDESKFYFTQAILQFNEIQNLTINLFKINNSTVTMNVKNLQINQFFMEKSNCYFYSQNRLFLKNVDLKNSFLSSSVQSIYLNADQLKQSQLKIGCEGFVEIKNAVINNENQRNNQIIIQGIIKPQLEYDNPDYLRNLLIGIVRYANVTIQNININENINFSFFGIINLYLDGIICILKNIPRKKIFDSFIQIHMSEQIVIKNVQYLNYDELEVYFPSFRVFSSDYVSFENIYLTNIYAYYSLFWIDNTDILFLNLNIIQSFIQEDPFFKLINCVNVKFEIMNIENKNVQKIIDYDKKNFSFEKKDLYDQDPKSSMIYYFCDKIVMQEGLTIYFLKINVDFGGYQKRFFDFQSLRDIGFIRINILDSNFQNMQSLKHGGCIRTKFYPNQLNLNNFQLNVTNTQFKQCNSIFYGGAIFTNAYMFLLNVIFRECNSYIGPAVVLHDSKFLFKKNVTFINNTSKKHDDIFIFWNNIEIDKILEFQKQNKTEYTKKEVYVDKYDQYNLTPGIFYMICFKIGREISRQKGDYKYIYDSEDDIFLYNLYEYLFPDQQQYFFDFNYNTSEYRFPYLLFKFNSQNIFDGKLLLQPFNQIFLKFKTTKCLSGMQKVLESSINNSYECQYCIDMFASYDDQGCQQCNSQYFDYCYFNISNVKKGYHRTEYTVDIQKIYKCKYNEESCQGGVGIGYQLCKRGHKCNECKCCDRTGEVWNETYVNSGQYSCIQCSQMKFNKSFMLGLFIFFIMVILFQINSYLNRIELLIKQNYLSKMSIMYFGTSFKNLGLSSVYFKIFSFYASMLYYMNQQVTLSIPKTLLSLSIQLQNPIVEGFVSLDCALTDFFSAQQNIEKIKLYFIILFPFSIFPVIMIIQLILLKKKIINKKWFFYSAFLSIIYLTFIIFYNSILSIVLDALFCHDFENGDRKSLLNLNVECKEMQLSLLITTIPILICYCIGIPTFIFTILILNSKNLSKIHIMFKYGFLYKEYKQKLYFWELIRFVVRVSQVIMSKLLLFDFAFMNCVNVIILVLYLKFLVQFKPFKRNFFNTLEQISILINIVNFFSLIIYQRSEEQNSSIILHQTAKIIIISSCSFSFVYLIYLFFMVIYSQLDEYIQKSERCQSCFCRRRRKVDFVKATKSMQILRQIVNRQIELNEKNTFELQEYILHKEEIRRNNIDQQELQEQTFNLIQNDNLQQYQPINELQQESLIILTKDNQKNENNSKSLQQCDTNDSSRQNQTHEFKDNSSD